MAKKLLVAIVGASGETGRSIVDALLDQPEQFDVLALARPSSLNSPAYDRIRSRGGRVAPLDLDGPADAILEVVRGADVLISCVQAMMQQQQMKLAEAAKAGGVGRFVPSFWATAGPGRGVGMLRELKEELLEHIKLLYIPYTTIDVGWWYQGTVPRLPSGRSDYASFMPVDKIPGDGTVKTCLTDLRDIGPLVARIIADPRTLNKQVFAYGEVWDWNSVFDLAEKVSGETIERKYFPATEITAALHAARAAQSAAMDPASLRDGSIDIETVDPRLMQAVSLEYMHSCNVRGDNSPESARYLGFLDAKDLYPDFRPRRYEEFLKEVLEGGAKAPYAGRTIAGLKVK